MSIKPNVKIKLIFQPHRMSQLNWCSPTPINILVKKANKADRTPKTSHVCNLFKCQFRQRLINYSLMPQGLRFHCTGFTNLYFCIFCIFEVKTVLFFSCLPLNQKNIIFYHQHPP